MEESPNFLNNSQSAPIPPHKLFSHWLVAAMAIVSVIGYFIASYSLALWPFGDLFMPLPTPIACTQEAKLCPDGSAVGRTGPYCEFAKCPNELNPSITPEQVPSDWKTYRNEEYGFEFRYPGDLIAVSDYQPYQIVSLQNRRGGEEILLLPDDIRVAVFVDEISGSFSVDNWLKKEYSEPQVDESNIIVVAGQQAYWVTFKNQIGAGNPRVFIPNGGKVFTITLDSTHEPGFDPFTLDQILSTFRFIDTVDTSTWKTYIKEKETFGIRYQINYPPDWTLSFDDNYFLIKDKNGTEFNINTPPLGFGIDNTVNEKTIIIDGREATQINFKGGNNRDRIWVGFKEKALENIQINFNTAQGSDAKIFDYILSTFKFIN